MIMSFRETNTDAFESFFITFSTFEFLSKIVIKLHFVRLTPFYLADA